MIKKTFALIIACITIPAHAMMTNSERLQHHQLKSPVKQNHIITAYSHKVGWQEAVVENPIPLSPRKASTDMVIKAKARIRDIKSKFIMNHDVYQNCKEINTTLGELSKESPEVKKKFKMSEKFVLDQGLSLAAAAAQLQQQANPEDKALAENTNALNSRIRRLRRKIAQDPEFLKPVKESNKIENMFTVQRQQAEEKAALELEQQDWQELANYEQELEQLDQRRKAQPLSQVNALPTQVTQHVTQKQETKEYIEQETNKENIKPKRSSNPISGKKRKKPTREVTTKTIENQRKRVHKKLKTASQGSKDIRDLFNNA